MLSCIVTTTTGYNNIQKILPVVSYQECTLVESNLKRGVFDALTMYIAAEFDANSDIALCLYKCSNDGGVLNMDEADRRNSESRMKNESHLLKKYDLTIELLCNLSDSFVFEGFVATLHNNLL